MLCSLLYAFLLWYYEVAEGQKWLTSISLYTVVQTNTREKSFIQVSYHKPPFPPSFNFFMDGQLEQIGGSDLPRICSTQWQPICNVTRFLCDTSGTQVSPTWPWRTDACERRGGPKKRVGQDRTRPLLHRKDMKHLLEHAKILLGESDPRTCMHTFLLCKHPHSYTPARKSPTPASSLNWPRRVLFIVPSFVHSVIFFPRRLVSFFLISFLFLHFVCVLCKDVKYFEINLLCQKLFRNKFVWTSSPCDASVSKYSSSYNILSPYIHLSNNNVHNKTPLWRGFHTPMQTQTQS